MTLTQLRTFLAVVELGSVRAAADRLVVSQPAVSGAVKALERELGLELLERDGRGIRPTAAGSTFAESVRRSLDHLDQGVRVAQSVEDPDHGTVRIAAIATAAERLLLPLLAGFRADHPEATVTVQVGNRATVWQALEHLDADLVVAGRPPAGLDAVVLGTAANTLVLVGCPPAPRTRRAAAALLASSTWLLREEGSGTRDAADALLVQLAIDPPRMILGSNGAVEEAVVGGFGVALLPLGALRGRLTSGAVVVLASPHTPVERPWHLVASSAATLPPTAALAARSLLHAPNGFTPSTAGRRLLS